MKAQQSLTPKARAAINVFVKVNATIEPPTMDAVIRWTLQAERMKRDSLYVWVGKHGYRWRASRKQWVLLGAGK